MISINPQEFLDRMINIPGQFAFDNGVEVLRVERDFAQGVLRPRANFRNPQGSLHGGLLATLADVVAGCCACSRGGMCVTSQATLEFLNSAGEEEITCRAVPKKMGRRLSVIAVTLTAPGDRVVATGTFTFFMVKEGLESAAQGTSETKNEGS